MRFQTLARLCARVSQEFLQDEEHLDERTPIASLGEPEECDAFLRELHAETGAPPAALIACTTLGDLAQLIETTLDRRRSEIVL